MDIYNPGHGSMPMPMYMPMRQSEGLFSQFQNFMRGNPLMSTILGGAGSLIGSGLNFLGQHMQNSWNERMWNEMNEYNTPEAQIQRFLDAGVNPAAAVASVTGTPNMTTMAQTGASSATAQGDLGEIGANANIRFSESENLQAQKEVAEAQKDYIESMTTGQDITNKWLDAKENASLKKLLQEGRISESTANMLAVDEFYKGREAAGHWMQTQLRISQMAQECKNLEADYFNKLAEYKVLMTQAGLNEALIQKAFSDIGLNNAQIAHLDHLNTYYDASAAVQWQNVNESKARTMLTQIQVEFEARYNDIFMNGGPDMRSDTNANLMYAIYSGNTALAKEICNGITAQTMSVGQGRFNSPDYNMDKAIDIFGDAMNLFGMFNFGGATRSTGKVTSKTYENKYNPGTKKFERTLTGETFTESSNSMFK